MGNSHVIGYDFETAPRVAGENNFNPYYVTPLELGAYANSSRARFRAVFRTTPQQAHLTPWHEKETPHLTPETLAQGEDRCAIMRDFDRFVRKHPGKVTLVGYNSDGFDRPLLQRLLRECHVNLPGNVEYADARTSFLRMYPGTPKGMVSGKLGDVCAYHRISAEGQLHSAATDAELAAKLYEELNI